MPAADQGNKRQQLVRTVGRALSVRRKARGLTQEQLSEAAGLTQASLSHIERGIVAPSLERLAQLAELLDCSLGELLSEVATGPTDRAMRIHEKLASLTAAQQESLERLIDDAIAMISDPRPSPRKRGRSSTP
ncbi:transcriptional regulator [Burkholderia sp. WAC0059]|uniref:helix-turn-helix domain-containing protein n=1 Tax=Burkholderia sp. WAC0059 TaxID=2066022 RepID=UPI000C7EA037|nr:helix-turn-helix domain-containing protein [Burkholderia sp. WAC0059]PLZ01758.1 transcriptional regulator [Burkholderia sp. WAC0059]